MKILSLVALCLLSSSIGLGDAPCKFHLTSYAQVVYSVKKVAKGWVRINGNQRDAFGIETRDGHYEVFYAGQDYGDELLVSTCDYDGNDAFGAPQRVNVTYKNGSIYSVSGTSPKGHYFTGQDFRSAAPF